MERILYHQQSVIKQEEKGIWTKIIASFDKLVLPIKNCPIMRGKLKAQFEFAKHLQRLRNREFAPPSD